MTRLSLLLAALAGPVWADPQVYVTEPGGDDGSVAWIIHDNQEIGGVAYTEELALEIDGYGTITGTLDNTPNIYCTPACPDTVVILDVPPGLAVVPPGVTTAEGAMSVMQVFEAVGF